MSPAILCAATLSPGPLTRIRGCCVLETALLHRSQDICYLSGYMMPSPIWGRFLHPSLLERGNEVVPARRKVPFHSRLVAHDRNVSMSHARNPDL